MLRVGIVGSGTMGQIHAENFSRIPDVKVTAIYCKRPDSAAGRAFGPPEDSVGPPVWAARRAEKYVVKLFNRSEDLFDHDEVDAVVICTPTPSHAEYAIGALKAGKHVFLEKPMARSLEEGQRILEAASGAKGKFMVGHVVRFCHEYCHARRLLEDGVIGRVGVVRTARRGRFPMGFGDWYADPVQSGGVILDMLIHDLDYLRWCFGPVKRVYAKNLLHRIGDHVDYGLVVMRFRNGIIAHLEASWAYEGDFHTAFEFSGTKGLIHFHSLETAPLTLFLKQGPASRERVAVPRPPLNESPYLLEVQHFVECIRKDRRPAIGAKEGYEALRLALAALQSARTGEPVEL